MELRVASANISVAAVKNRPRDVQHALEGLFENYGVHSVGLQEAGEGIQLVKAAAHAVDAEVYFGEGRPGEDSTPIIYLKSLKNPKFSSIQLTGFHDAGKGSVVDKLHPKYLVTVKYGFGRHRVKHNNTHGIVSQQVAVNDRLAEQQFHKVAGAVGTQRGIRFVSLDANNVPGAQNLVPLERELNSSQRMLGKLKTKDDRAIDDIYCIRERGLYVPRRHFTVKNPGDHLWYVLAGTVG